MPESPSLPVLPTVCFYAGLGAFIVMAVRLVQGSSSPLDYVLLGAGTAAMALAIWMGSRRPTT